MSSVDDETILEVLRSSDEPRLTTTEVADELPITRGTTRTRLQTLVDEGLVTREREGRNVVWWLPERTDEADSATATESDDDPAGEDDGHGEQASETEGADEAEDEDVDIEADEAEDEDADSEADEAEDEDETDEEPAAEEEEADEEPAGEPEQTEPSVHAGESSEVETDEDDGIEVTTPDRETRSPAERLPEAPQDDRTVQAVLALFALAVLYALVRRLRG